MKIVARHLLILFLAIPPLAQVHADEKYTPEDPIAAVDGEAIFLGELNLILTERFKPADLRRVAMEVQQVTAALLVRRHLAMKTLRSQGGESLEAMIRRQIDGVAAEASRRGSSLAEQARLRMADENSLKAHLAWRTAWAQYLKSKLTEANLRRFFEQRRIQYAGHRWEVSQIFLKMDPTDTAAIANAEQSLADLAGELSAADDPEQAFATAAQQHSDAGSAGNGGMVGWVKNDGDLPGSVMAVVRKTSDGKIGGPVRSPLGLHLVYVHQSEPGELEFEQMTDQTQLRRDAIDALFSALINQQSEANIQWFIPALKPPSEVAIFPQP